MKLPLAIGMRIEFLMSLISSPPTRMHANTYDTVVNNDVYLGSTDVYGNYTPPPPATPTLTPLSPSNHLLYHPPPQDMKILEMDSHSTYLEPMAYPHGDIVGQSLQQAFNDEGAPCELIFRNMAITETSAQSTPLPPMSEFSGVSAYDQWSGYSSTNYYCEAEESPVPQDTPTLNYFPATQELIPDMVELPMCVS